MTQDDIEQHDVPTYVSEPLPSVTVDPSVLNHGEIVLEAVFDPHLVGVRTIYETMKSLNPHFGVRVLPDRVSFSVNVHFAICFISNIQVLVLQF